MAKRKPKTESGRAAVRRNAVKHGISSESPVLTGLERESDWQEHLAGTLDSLSPEGHLETEFAERIALLFWRLRRVARYEREMIEVAQEQIDEAMARTPMIGEVFRYEASPDQKELANKLASWEAALSSLEKLSKMANDEQIADDDLSDILNGVTLAFAESSASFYDVEDEDEDVEDDEDEDDEDEDVEDDEDDEDEDVEDDEDEDENQDDEDAWTVAKLRARLASVADEEGITVDGLLESVADRADTEITSLRKKLEQIALRRDWMSRERLLPDEFVINRLTRYEAHLHRQLIQTMHELEAMQGRRRGVAMPLARHDVVGMTTTDD